MSTAAHRLGFILGNPPYLLIQSAVAGSYSRSVGITVDEKVRIFAFMFGLCGTLPFTVFWRTAVRRGLGPFRSYCTVSQSVNTNGHFRVHESERVGQRCYAFDHSGLVKVDSIFDPHRHYQSPHLLDTHTHFALQSTMRTRSLRLWNWRPHLPAALFMTALVVRSLSYCITNRRLTAQQLVMWYAGRMWTLWVLLLALHFTVLVTGCATLPI